ncbi:hypothetical protein ACFCV3_26925 [Kribbella sp. NPDC056345]|uniref:hypothetical protein n=1 Tax=Kribbella sp. NPDC056345 TaxID=3345789 RepID=UPI0035D88124
MPSLNGAVVLVTGANGEVIARELTAKVKAAPSGPIEGLYPELHDTKAPLVTREE